MVSEYSIGCIWLPHFRARLKLARHPELEDRLGVIVDRSARKSIVLDYLPAVPDEVAGMTLEHARALESNLVALESDEPHYWREFERVLQALEALSDRVESAELGVAYVGLDGLEAMHCGEKQLWNALCQAVPGQFKPRIGVGPNKFISLVAARVRRSSGVTAVPRDLAAFLAPYPIDLLPCSSDLVEDLLRLGFDTMGDVAEEEPNALLDRFGHEGRRAWELANGIDERSLQPRTHEEPVVETLSLPTELTTLDLLQAAVDTMLQRAYAQSPMQGRMAATVTLTCVLENAPTWQRAFHFKRTMIGWQQAAEIIGACLETEHPQAPVEAMTVTLTNLSGATGTQLSLFHDARADREQRLLEIERGLQARLGGTQALHRLVEVAPWHPTPELRAMQVSIDPSADDGMQPLNMPTSVAVNEGPEQEPLAVRIDQRWREVAQIEDQWSFDLWWQPTPTQRHYYRISQDDGRQLVLFRDQRKECWYRQGASS